MPTIHTGSSTGLRCSLASRSVPMLPGPIRAHLIFYRDAQVVARGHRHHDAQRARQHHLARLERDARRPSVLASQATALAG
jgi:hypothetical protein